MMMRITNLRKVLIYYYILSTNWVLCILEAMRIDEEHSESKQKLSEIYTELDQVCGGDYTIIGDNLDLLVKIVGTNLKKKNKFYHWFHLIGKIDLIM